MNPRVMAVIPNDDYSLLLTFESGEMGRFDVSPYLSLGIFSELRDKTYFQQVRVAGGTVQWPHEQDFCPDTLYELSEKLLADAA